MSKTKNKTQLAPSRLLSQPIKLKTNTWHQNHSRRYYCQTTPKGAPIPGIRTQAQKARKMHSQINRRAKKLNAELARQAKEQRQAKSYAEM